MSQAFRTLLFTGGLLLALPLHAGGFSPDARAAMDGLKAFNSGWNDVSATLKTTTHGKIKAEGTAQMQSLNKADGSQKIRIRVESPAGAKGTGFMSHIASDGGMKQWLFVPASGKVFEVENSRRSGPFLGTEFTFEDLAIHPKRFAVSDAEEEDCDIEGKELDCQLLTLTPTPGTSSYDKLHAWVDEDDNRLRIVEFFKKDKKVKTLLLEDYGHVANKHWVPQKLTMTNNKTQRHTVLLWQDISFESGLTDASFAPEKLSEGVAQTRVGPK